MQLGLSDDSKLIQNKFILRQLKEYSNIYKALKTLDDGIPKIHILLFMPRQIQIRQEMLMREKSLVEDHSIWGPTWYHGSTKNTG